MKTNSCRITAALVLALAAGSAAAHGDHGRGLLLEGIAHLLQAEHLPVTVTLVGAAVLVVRQRAPLQRLLRRLWSRR